MPAKVQEQIYEDEAVRQSAYQTIKRDIKDRQRVGSPAA
jgi:hypothetical protein